MPENEKNAEAPADETPKQKKEREAAEAVAAQEAEANRLAAEQEAAERRAAEEAKANQPRKLKFMGSADERLIPRGDTAGKTLPELPIDISFNRENGWIVSSDEYADVPKVWWDHLALNEPGIEEITEIVAAGDMIPLNDHQRIFLGMVQVGEAKRVAEPSVGGMPVSSSDR